MNKKYNSHRLKLNNILFWDEEKYEIILMDFGISCFSNGIYKEIVKAFSIIFLPHEVLRGFNFSSNIKLDILSSGIILFRMIERKFILSKLKKKKKSFIILIKIKNEE